MTRCTRHLFTAAAGDTKPIGGRGGGQTLPLQAALTAMVTVVLHERATLRSSTPPAELELALRLLSAERAVSSKARVLPENVPVYATDDPANSHDLLRGKALGGT